MLYVSTRGEAPTLDFSGALLAGLARDGGLYVPESWPALSAAEIAGFAGKPFHEVAAAVLKPFIGGAIPQAVVLAEAKAAYATFGHPAVTPLVQIGPNRFILELFHGPTLAFKDVAMQLLARLMDHVLAERNEHVTLLALLRATPAAPPWRRSAGARARMWWFSSPMAASRMCSAG